jgi:2,3-bisphosphoglycerate-independent phosphoglycerate mutase
MGNSEVGHLNLGAGRVVYQDIVRIDRAIADGSFAQIAAFGDAMDRVKERGTLHLMGLLSDGGVHSHQRHLHALIDMARERGVHDVCVHAILDGRDTSPQGGEQYLAALAQHINAAGVGRIATLIGRYYAMDRDKRWDRTRKAYDLYTLGRGAAATDALNAVRESYTQGITDEFVEPVSIAPRGTPPGLVMDGDSLICFNFRAVRARE